MRRRAVEQLFGVASIVVGVGVIIAPASDIDLPWILVPAMALAVAGWAIYHYVVDRSAPSGVERPEDSPPRDD